MPERASDLWWLFTRQTVCVTQKENIIDAALLMYNRNFRHLPVVLGQSSKVIGIISAQDIVDSLNLALRSYSFSPEQVRESLCIPLEKVMSLSTIAIEPGDGLAQIIKKVVYHNIGALPVLNEEGIIQGIITLRDLVSLIGTSSSPLGVPVSDVMNTKITTIRSDESFIKAVQLMSERRIRRLPVLSEKGKMLMGVITNKDILQYLLEATGKKRTNDGLRSRQFDEPISQLMTKDVITINRDDDLRVAASRMMIFGVGGLVIEETPEQKIGLITERDLIRTLSIKKSVDFLVRAMHYESDSEGMKDYRKLLEPSKR
jgi:CBS domain-containing protein